MASEWDLRELVELGDVGFGGAGLKEGIED